MNSNSICAPGNWTRISAALAVLALSAGCSPMTQTQCASANWYDLGYRDGDMYGIQPRIDQYAYQCRAVGVEAQAPAYLAGWKDGYGERASRVQTDFNGR
jgi:Protein of unknown function (DUF2799)